MRSFSNVGNMMSSFYYVYALFLISDWYQVLERKKLLCK